MHQHSPACWSIEPCEIKHRLGLTGTKETPLPVNPGLNPGMIAVGMSPTRGIYLTSRNTNCTQGSNKKSRFLSATAICGLYRSKRRTCSSVRWHIYCLLVAPVIHFKHGLAHSHMLYPWSKLLIKDIARTVQILIVHPDREHKMTHLTLRHPASPRHFVQSPASHPVMVEIVLRSHVQHISKRHICIQELKSLLLVGFELHCIKVYGSRLKYRLPGGKVLADLLTV